MTDQLRAYKNELQQELDDILSYWMRYAPDPVYGGFYGKIDDRNRVHPEAPRGIVLNSRILWTFAAAFNQTLRPAYFVFAERAYNYIISHFIDEQYGGVYWSVNYKGERLNDRKQVYGLAFCIYGLSEYYKATRKQTVLELAITLYRLIEQHAYDARQKGYYEAFSRDWEPMSDLRLSEKDANEKKTMNTHLHIVEAYINLYSVWPDTGLKQQIENLLEVFAHHIVDNKTHHLNLFFDEDWKIKSRIISYGHDIEAAWLLQEAAGIIHHPGWMIAMSSLAVKIADAVQEGLDKDDGLKYESGNGHCVDEKHWWPQAEAMIGFFNAYQVSGDKNYIQQSIKSWRFTHKYIKDHNHGEWFWGIHADHSVMEGNDKAGFWKCPYHNGRACMELIDRIESMFGDNN